MSQVAGRRSQATCDMRHATCSHGVGLMLSRSVRRAIVSVLLLLLLGGAFAPRAQSATARDGALDHRVRVRPGIQSLPLQPELVADLRGDMRQISVAGALAYVGENIGGNGALSVLD